MNNVYLFEEYAKQRQSEFLLEAGHGRVVRGRSEYPQEQNGRLPFVGHLFNRVAEFFYRLSAWILGTAVDPIITSPDETLHSVCRGR